MRGPGGKPAGRCRPARSGAGQAKGAEEEEGPLCGGEDLSSEKGGQHGLGGAQHGPDDGEADPLGDLVGVVVLVGEDRLDRPPDDEGHPGVPGDVQHEVDHLLDQGVRGAEDPGGEKKEKGREQAEGMKAVENGWEGAGGRMVLSGGEGVLFFLHQ